MKTICSLCCITIVALHSFAQPRAKEKLFLVCGDTKVILVDYNQSRDSIPKVVWSWDARQAKDLPDEYRLRKFNSMDDCKAAKNGTRILVSSSSGAVALLSRKTKKVLFYASVPNAHSIALLPHNRLVAAASTAVDGNKIILFRMRRPNLPLYLDSLYSAHGVVWSGNRRSLFALGYNVLREYKLVAYHNLKLVNEWRIPGVGGHDLQLSPDRRKLFITEHNGCWKFDLRNHQFSKIEWFPDVENIKSLGQSKTGQYIFTVPEESWWTFHVRFFNPEKKLAFPDMKVYKARWFGE